MSKLDVLLLALVLVVTASAMVILAMLVISILSALKPLAWIVLGLGLLLTILIAIGIYQFEKHYLK